MSQKKPDDKPGCPGNEPKPAPKAHTGPLGYGPHIRRDLEAKPLTQNRRFRPEQYREIDETGAPVGKNAPPEYLPGKEHTKVCWRCNLDYGSIKQGFQQYQGEAKYRTVCRACMADTVAKRKLVQQVAERGVDNQVRRELVVAVAKEKAKAEKRKRDKQRAAWKGNAPKSPKNTTSLGKKIELAQQELAKRELARRRLINFILRFNPNYKAGWVHKIICAKLEWFSNQVALEQSPRQLFFMPPRLGKSEIASKNFPAWHLGKNPSHEIIAGSYAVSLPLGFSRWIKQTVQDKSYQSLFPDCQLDPNNSAAEGWKTTLGGGYTPAGVGLGITGKGAHVLIIDDPIKDMVDADSATIRNNTWDWWDSTAETRLAPGGGVLGIQTRWNDDDWAGRLLTQEKEALNEIDEQRNDLLGLIDASNDLSEIRDLREKLAQVEKSVEEVVRWDVMSLAALAEEDEYADTQGNLVQKKQGRGGDKGFKLMRRKDEALHPERYDELFFRRKRKSSSPRIWSALYQQNPIPESGVYFKSDDFRFEDNVPSTANMNVYAAWDLAIGQRQTNDWTVGFIAGHDPEDRVHILNRVRVRTDALAELILDSCEPYKKNLQLIGIEQGQIQQAIMPSLRKLMDDRRWWPSFDESLKPVTDKLARARPAQGWMQQGRILIPKNQPWVESFMAELLRFPGGVHDDQVDALAWLIRMISVASPPRENKVQQRRKSWKDKISSKIGTVNHHLGA